jgi:hypothetical protein
VAIQREPVQAIGVGRPVSSGATSVEVVAGTFPGRDAVDVARESFLSECVARAIHSTPTTFNLLNEVINSISRQKRENRNYCLLSALPAIGQN